MDDKHTWFERIFMKISLVLIIMGMLLPIFFQLRDIDLSFLRLHSVPFENMQYWNNTDTKNAPFAQVARAPENDFSTTRPVADWKRKYIWVRLHLPSGETFAHERLYTAYEYWRIRAAYAYGQGQWRPLQVQNDDIYSSVTIPGDIDHSAYVYIQLSGDSIGDVLLFRMSSHAALARLQNWMFTFRMFNISLLIVLLGLNAMLAVHSRHSEYSAHALLMLASVNTLLQISGIPQLLWGQTNVYAGSFWGFMTCLMGTLFQYKYFGIKQLPHWLVRLYRWMLSIMLLLTFFIGMVQIPVIVGPLHGIIVVICTIGISTVLYAYRHQHVPTQFILGTMLMFLGIFLYVLGCFGFLPWNHITANLVYPALSGESILFTSGIMLQIRQKQGLIDQLKQEADTDRLTSLCNRNYFDTVSTARISQQEAESRSVSMIMADIDHFKNVNDTYGHNAGDVLLQEIAELLRNHVRKADDVIRWGGEEFLIIAYDMELEQAMSMAEKLRKQVEAYPFMIGEQVTVSLGVAEKHQQESVRECVGRADAMLYQAKAAGRNCTCRYQALM